MLVRQAAIYAVGRGLPGIVNFLAVMVYTRLLAPDDYGLYALALAAVGLAHYLLFAWLHLGLLRFLAAAGARSRELLAIVLCGFAASAALVLVAAVAAAAFRPASLSFGLYALCLTLVGATAWFELNLELARARLTPVRYSLMAACRAVASLGLGVLLIRAGLGAHGVLAGLLLGLILTLLAFTRDSWRGAHPRHLDPRLARELLAYGLPLTASLTLTFIVAASDRFFIGWILGPDQVGVYAAGYDTAWHTLTMLMMLIHLAGYPLAVQALERQGVAACRRELRHYLPPAPSDRRARGGRHRGVRGADRRRRPGRPVPRRRGGADPLGSRRRVRGWAQELLCRPRLLSRPQHAGPSLGGAGRRLQRRAQPLAHPPLRRTGRRLRRGRRLPPGLRPRPQDRPKGLSVAATAARDGKNPPRHGPDPARMGRALSVFRPEAREAVAWLNLPDAAAPRRLLWPVRLWWAVYLLLLPLYHGPSGYPQLSHLYLAATAPIVLVLCLSEFGCRARRCSPAGPSSST